MTTREATRLEPTHMGPAGLSMGCEPMIFEYKGRNDFVRNINPETCRHSPWKRRPPNHRYSPSRPSTGAETARDLRDISRHVHSQLYKAQKELDFLKRGSSAGSQTHRSTPASRMSQFSVLQSNRGGSRASGANRGESRASVASSMPSTTGSGRFTPQRGDLNSSDRDFLSPGERTPLPPLQTPVQVKDKTLWLSSSVGATQGGVFARPRQYPERTPQAHLRGQ